ncbi:MAG: hypothetical protein JWN90_280 [Parcubacteria group bacterium]|nr:hypothetical protein [Parcubacteria group bacterium]
MTKAIKKMIGTNAVELNELPNEPEMGRAGNGFKGVTEVSAFMLEICYHEPGPVIEVIAEFGARGSVVCK